ncbi:MAG: YdeI/OmpD-associated family protein [Prolixibacteraceae bacterium]|jgi:uncharacterized protein YdeI (YjbR/CyaY-like superfamily)
MVTKRNNSNDYPVLSFEEPAEWEMWLEQNHSASNGVWLKFHKKASGLKSVNYNQALDVALCFGWIDGQATKFDENSYLQKFTPRRPKSIWSKRNIEHVARLEKEGRMRLSGQKAVELAKADGRWEMAYDSPAQMSIPEDFLGELAKNKKAYEFFESLNKANKYAIAWRLQTAKRPETRAKRMQTILEMMDRGERFH